MDTHKEWELEQKFWKALKSDRTVMMGVDGMEDGHSRPLTAMTEGDEGGPIWFFIGKPNAIVEHLSQHRRAIAAFSSKGHDLFASVRGTLSIIGKTQPVTSEKSGNSRIYKLAAATA